MKSKYLFVLAGAAASLSSVALADQPAVSRDEVRAIVSEMLSDAETRSSLLAGGGTAGYDKNFFIASADNNFRLNFSGYSQWRYTLSFRDNKLNGPTTNNAPTGTANQSNEFENGFTNHRTYLQFDGNVINPDFKFVINGEFSDNNTTGNFNLRDAFFTYNLGSGWWIKGGQFRQNFLKEETIFDTRQLASERSVTNFVFTQGRSQGVEVGYRQDEWRFTAEASDGFQSANTDFATAAGAPNYAESDWAVGGRAEWAIVGKLEDFDSFTSKQDDPFGAYIGAAIHGQGSANTAFSSVGGVTTTGQSDTRYLTYTVDGMIKGSGWSLYAAFIGSDTNFRNTRATPATPGAAANVSSYDDYGFIVQGSWRFLKETEAFVRYDATWYDNSRGFTDDRQDFITFGVNHYFAGQAARLTLDAIISLQPTTDAAGTFIANPVLIGSATTAAAAGNAIGTAQGLLRSQDDTTVALRAQFQFMF